MKTIIIILSGLLLFFKSESQINYTVNISTSDMTISQIIAKDSTVYTKVNIKNLYTSAEPGNPFFPEKFIYIYIPEGKDVNNITVSSSSVTTYNLTTKIFPIQLSIPISLDSIIPGFTQPNSMIYSSNNVYPSEMVKVVNKGYFDGRNQIVTIAINPFQYYPLTNKLNLYSTISFTLNLKQCMNSQMISPKHTANTQSLYDNILKSLVDNPQDIITSNTQQTLTTSQPFCSLPVYEYVIITDASLVSGFSNFVDWKKKKGINIGIVTTNDIYNCSGYSTGDIISTPAINDNAGKIRQYLHDAWLNGTTWALIAGDVNHQVPYRIEQGYGVPTDSYFADLTGNWSNYSYPFNYPDIFVGRLICSNITDIQNWSNNVLQYEQNPGNSRNGDYSYLLNSFSIEANEMQGDNSGETVDQASEVATHLQMFAPTIMKEYPNGAATYDNTGLILTPSGYTGQYGTTTGNEVIAEWNNNHFGLISWFCHGGSGFGASKCEGGSNIQTMGPSPYMNAGYTWKLNAQQAYQYCNSDVIQETDNGLDDLTNSNYPSILYALSCNVTPFDVTENNNNGGAMNCGEAFTTLPNTGGVAFLGNTEDGLVDMSYLIYNNFANLITSSNNNSIDGIYSPYSHLGISEAISKHNYQGTDKEYLNYSPAGARL